GPARIAKAPPQQRPMFMRPSCVNRNTGRPCSFARRSAVRMSLAQPISSKRLSSALGCRSATRLSTQAANSRSATTVFSPPSQRPDLLAPIGREQEHRPPVPFCQPLGRAIVFAPTDLAEALALGARLPLRDPLVHPGRQLPISDHGLFTRQRPAGEPKQDY